MEEGSSRQLAVLLHADVVGSTALVQLNETLAHERIRDVFRRFSEIISSHGGTAHEIRGDALVAEFSRASDAVGASLAFQVANTAHNEELPDDIRPVVRVGIAMGEVVIADNTVTGAGIVLAQRLEQVADPGGVVVQGAVSETVPTRLPFFFTSLGERMLKGFDQPIRAFAVGLESGEGVEEKQIEAERLAPADSGLPSIAVLPLVNMSGDPGEDYFCDGLSEDITTELSRFRDLNVISRTSCFAYRGKMVDARDVGRELGAQHILEGSVRRAGGKIRVNAQLVDTVNGHHVWAERYDRDMEDVFAVQDEITQVVVATLVGRVEDAMRERARSKTTDSLAAYDYVLRADENMEATSEVAIVEARRLYLKALALDPDYARAHAGVSYTYHTDWGFFFGSGSSVEAQDMALEYARNAVKLDDSDSRSHFILSTILTYRGDYDQARAHQKKCVALNPNDADVLARMGYSLPILGKATEATELGEKAVTLNPFHPSWYLDFLGTSYYSARQYERAISVIETAGSVRTESRGYLAAAYAQIGQTGKARNETRNFIESCSPDPWWTKTPDSVVPVNKDTTGFLTYMNQQADSEHMLDGLRRAGF